MAGWTSLFSVVLLTQHVLVAEGFFLAGPRVSARRVCGVRGSPRLSSLLKRGGDEEQEQLLNKFDPIKVTSQSSPVETSPTTTRAGTTIVTSNNNNNNSGNKKDPPEQPRPTTTTTTTKRRTRKRRRSMTLTWCGNDLCTEHNLREKVVDNQIVLSGPATGQVAYTWNTGDEQEEEAKSSSSTTTTSTGGWFLVFLQFALA
jgi:hypothetical protein